TTCQIEPAAEVETNCTAVVGVPMSGPAQSTLAMKSANVAEGLASVKVARTTVPVSFPSNVVYVLTGVVLVSGASATSIVELADWLDPPTSLIVKLKARPLAASA